MLSEYDHLQHTAAIGQLFEITMRERDNGVTEEALDECREAAVSLIHDAGFDGSDSDYFGRPMEDETQTLLMVVMARVPQLRELILDGEIGRTV